MGNYLYYLVSKRNEKTGLQKGRLICLNKKTGLAEWTARDMTFTNFGRTGRERTKQRVRSR